jgi:hypothetical protein
MLCTFCNTARLANEAPCPHCGTPSPLTSASMQAATPWASTASLPTQAYTSNQSRQATPFSAAPRFPFPMEQQPASLLPVPYQQPSQPQQLPALPVTDSKTALMPVPVQNIGPLVPVQPQEETTIYVPPMYTKPRPIIPRYRIISGLLSVIIVTFLLCIGTTYYVKASGSLNALGRFSGLTTPPNLQPTPTNALPDPPRNQETGPAVNIITSATTTAQLNDHNVATKQDVVFQPNQTIYLTYSTQKPKQPGTVIVKWYTNGQFYQDSEPKVIAEAGTGVARQQYAQPAEGMVEIYWNNQLAIRLYFVVR